MPPVLQTRSFLERLLAGWHREATLIPAAPPQMASASHVATRTPRALVCIAFFTNQPLISIKLSKCKYPYFIFKAFKNTFVAFRWWWSHFAVGDPSASSQQLCAALGAAERREVAGRHGATDHFASHSKPHHVALAPEHILLVDARRAQHASHALRTAASVAQLRVAPRRRL